MACWSLRGASTSTSTTSTTNEISPPLFMSIPQQLIAVFMLGIDSPTMLEPTGFGFELMSTHFVKCALAASAVVNNANRPSVKDVLGTIGFEVDDGVTSDNIKATWDSLGQWTSFLADAGSESTYHARTRQLDIGLKIVSNSTTPGKLLQIETQLLWALTQLEMFPGPGNKIFPIACVNEGNSDLCDGLVTFCAKKKDTEREFKKITIMIQAKDYHGDSRVDVGKMNGHAAKK
ncbi:unknown protein [Seminavis robusta]|uniref:Uncharacterized protein n=1 Tax=Seminavis robusta TaxID=568900 RepID=A0A9N8F0G3_9STRA|nr:unknown protein [Seminavis robusta]|eukprot:Sro2361_g324780.1 n/a (233) ;mRNA; r:4974-5672